MMKLSIPRDWSWAGVFGGFAFWYFAHEFGFYFSGHACEYVWAMRLVHVIALFGAVFSGVISYRALRTGTFAPLVGVAASALFSLVIFWQGIAAFIFRGCER